ncbi:MAG: TlpA family protein disulfide reductase [Ignavibacteria bacterium]
MKKTFLAAILLLFTHLVLSQDVNSPAPDFTGKDMNNNPVKLSDFKGKVVLLDFWASWCVPCKKSIPYLIDYYNNNKDTNFAILAVNVDTDNDSFKSFLAKLSGNLPFTVILDNENNIIKKYNIEAMPTTIFIDKKGTVRKITTGFTKDSPEEYSGEITKLLSE